jgi:hypothetical protein
MKGILREAVLKRDRCSTEGQCSLVQDNLKWY